MTAASGMTAQGAFSWDVLVTSARVETSSHVRAARLIYEKSTLIYQLTYDTCDGRFNNWINSGTKGEDFVRNLGIPQFDFYCIHVVRHQRACGTPDAARRILRSAGGCLAPSTALAIIKVTALQGPDSIGWWLRASHKKLLQMESLHHKRRAMRSSFDSCQLAPMLGCKKLGTGLMELFGQANPALRSPAAPLEVCPVA